MCRCRACRTWAGGDRRRGEAFLQYWADSLNYLLQTGDPQYVREAMSADNDQFTKVMENYERYYREGKWSVGTEQQIYLEPQPLEKVDPIPGTLRASQPTQWGLLPIRTR
ncbi:Uncharacterised protein [Rothia kristinae]|nr:Uncharacterised protein [Rothia kristinae]